MERVPGVALSEKWDCMSDDHRYKLIERIVEVERELATLRFPAHGSLYFRDSLPDGSPRCQLDSTLDPLESFCIGPPCGRSWWRAGFSNTTETGMGSGPCQLAWSPFTKHSRLV